MGREISEGRKFAFYLGSALMVIGLLTFFSVFVSAALQSGDPLYFEVHGRSIALRAFGGFFLIVVGIVMRIVGYAGAAGAGVVLDPQQAREDLEPHVRMAGGMLKDALDAAGLVREGEAPASVAPAQQVVKIRCRACGKLNEEDSKFCQECGQPV